jgi:dTDP-4-dehydrorhamnose 3,5-epimerase
MIQVIPTTLPDVLIIKPEVFGDHRGFFLETYHKQNYAGFGILDPFVQDNHSGSRQGTLRGLHYQLKHPQGKLIRVVVGEVFDVAVDMRRHSDTFGRWVGTKLSAETKNQLWVPPGFAHGFYILSEWAEVLYKVTDFYQPDDEHTVRWDDPDIGVAWPILPDIDILVSDKDRQGIAFRDAAYYQNLEGSI